MIEFDTRAKAKENAEFITPPALREFIAEKVQGEDIDLLDVSIGSGQLLFGLADRIAHVTGYDVNAEALEASAQNFAGKCTLRCQDYITSEDDGYYEVCVCNYPFSLKPTDEQRQAILRHPFLSLFYKGKVTGVLDFPFIMKSFAVVEDGYYLCFPGIGYRAQERTFRQYLVDNGFIHEYGQLTNCKFEHTSISILYLHLSRTPCDCPNSFTLDFKTGELYEQPADFDDYTFVLPHKPEEAEEVDPVQLERQAREGIEKRLTEQYKFSRAVWQLDERVRGSGMEAPAAWLKGMMGRVAREYQQLELF